MAPDGVDFGRALRRRRNALGLSQARLAEIAGVSSSRVGRWERGEAQPTSDVVGRIRGVLQLTDAEAAVWAVALDPPPPPPMNPSEISLEFEVLEDASPEEWLPAHKRVRAPNLDRRALTGNRQSVRHLQTAEAADGEGPSDVFAPRSRAAERRREKLKEGIERRAKQTRERQEKRAERYARQEAVRDMAEAVGEGALAMPSSANGRFGYEPHQYTPDSHLGEYLSIANTGSAFPIPDKPKAQKKYPYSQGPPTLKRDWPKYWLRTFLMLVVLGILAGILAWSVFELGEGWSAVVDLFRDNTPEEPIGELTDAVGVLYGF